jgi:predicted 2-oxoglutarate/Fe(II)-dependent dioxygenase YbiX
VADLESDSRESLLPEPLDLGGVAVCVGPPHSLAVPAALCDVAVEHVVWSRTQDESPRRARVGSVDVKPATRALWEHVVAAIDELNLAGARVPWEPSQAVLRVLRYRPGQCHPWHDDTTIGYASTWSGLVLSAIVQLSDPAGYEGAAVQLDVGGGVVVEVPRGRGTVAVFPSSLRHRVRLLTRGERWAMTVFCPARGEGLRAR